VVVAPETPAGAAEVFADAARAARRVSIEREGGDVVLSTRGLARILEHEAGDLTVAVEAGVRLSELDARLAGAGQMLALDPPGDPTIGACLAGDLSGPRRHRYGAPRDLVLGVTVVLADGTVASSGGKVVKNVAGYDLGKLFCGSRGRLGLIARAALRLHPRPAAEGTHVVTVDDSDDAYRICQLVHRSQLTPSACDLLWRGSGSRLALLFEGSDRAVAAQLSTARELLGGEPADGSVWEESRAWQAGARSRITFPPRGLAQTLGLYRVALVRPLVGSGYVPEAVHEQREAGAVRLAERVRAAFDPAGLLV
jgi:glycolate oxidase FAD binding subunit